MLEKQEEGSFNIPVIINSRKYILLIVGIHLCPLIKLGHWSHRKFYSPKEGPVEHWTRLITHYISLDRECNTYIILLEHF